MGFFFVSEPCLEYFKQLFFCHQEKGKALLLRLFLFFPMYVLVVIDCVVVGSHFNPLLFCSFFDIYFIAVSVYQNSYYGHVNY